MGKLIVLDNKLLTVASVDSRSGNCANIGNSIDYQTKGTTDDEPLLKTSNSVLTFR